MGEYAPPPPITIPCRRPTPRPKARPQPEPLLYRQEYRHFENKPQACRCDSCGAPFAGLAECVYCGTVRGGDDEL